MLQGLARLPALGEEMTNEDGARLVATITQVEKHLRKRQMAVPFMSQLGQKSSMLPSDAEARKLAFFIFWNIKPFFDRCVPSGLPALASREQPTSSINMALAKA